MEKIILYTSTECSRCKVVKQMLHEHNVVYEEITDNKELMVEKDLFSVPAIEIGNKIIDTYAGVMCWLRDNGYYSLALWGEYGNESD